MRRTLFSFSFLVPRSRMPFCGILLFYCFIVLLFSGSSVSAATAGDLIKASGSSVYYLASDGKRYVFPTEKTYFTWYNDFSSVKTISDAELASYPLGGNVTYKPGVKMVKITTDPKVYAIARGGTLRWVQTEQIATSLYGADWASKIDDIPDAFFVNYRIGAPVAAPSDYAPNAERDVATSIMVDKAAITPSPAPAAPPAGGPTPTPTPTPYPPPAPPTPDYTGSIVSSNTSPRAGDTVTLTARAQPSGSIQIMKLFFDGALQRTCEFTPCATDILIPLSNTKPSYELALDVAWIDNHRLYTTSSLSVGAAGSSGILLTVSRPEVKPNGIREIILEATQGFIAKYLDIFIDGGNAKGCTNTQVCRYSSPETNATGTTHTVYGIATDANGFTKKSHVESIRVVDNDRPYLTMRLGKSSIYRGETVDVSVSATDDDGVAWTELWLDGAKLKHCDSGLCTVTAGPWSETRTLNFVGKASDTTEWQNSATSTTVTVNP